MDREGGLHLGLDVETDTCETGRDGVRSPRQP